MVMNSCEHETEGAQPLIYYLDIIENSDFIT